MEQLFTYAYFGETEPPFSVKLSHFFLVFHYQKDLTKLHVFFKTTKKITKKYKKSHIFFP